MGNMLEEQVEPMVVSIANQRGGTALDLGCGTGRNAIYLAQNGYHVTAVDTDTGALKTLMKTARQKNVGPRVKTREGDLIECVSGEWDVILVNLVLHRFARDDAKFLLTRVQAGTKTFGMNAIIGWADEGARADEIRTEYPNAFFLTKEFLHERYQRWHAERRGNRTQNGGRVLTGLYRK
jgi:tellurite methyltransferase